MTFTSYYALFPFTISSFAFGRSAAWMTLGPSHPPTPSCIL